MRESAEAETAGQRRDFVQRLTQVDLLAADRYAKDPVHDAWTEPFAKIREASLSPQITND